MGKVIHWELCKKKNLTIRVMRAQPRIRPRKCDAQTSLWVWDLGQTTRTSDSQQKIYITGQIVDFALLTDDRVKIKENEKRDKYLNLARERKKNNKKLWNMKMTMIPIVFCALGTIPKRTGGHGNKRTSRNHPDYCIAKIDQNTEKSPGDLRRLAVTQTPEENHQLTLV